MVHRNMWAVGDNVKVVVAASPAGADQRRRLVPAADNRQLNAITTKEQSAANQQRKPTRRLYSDAVHLEAAPVRVCLVGALATRPAFAGTLQALTFPRSAGASDPECGKHNIKRMWQN
jgi:hypothetical protein